MRIPSRHSFNLSRRLITVACPSSGKGRERGAGHLYLAAGLGALLYVSAVLGLAEAIAHVWHPFETTAGEMAK